MIGSWNRSILSKVNIGGRIPSKNRNINIYIEIVLDLIKTLQDSSKNTK